MYQYIRRLVSRQWVRLIQRWFHRWHLYPLFWLLTRMLCWRGLYGTVWLDGIRGGNDRMDEYFVQDEDGESRGVVISYTFYKLASSWVSNTMHGMRKEYQQLRRNWPSSWVVWERKRIENCKIPNKARIFGNKAVLQISKLRDPCAPESWEWSFSTSCQVIISGCYAKWDGKYGLGL